MREAYPDCQLLACLKFAVSAIDAFPTDNEVLRLGASVRMTIVPRLVNLLDNPAAVVALEAETMRQGLESAKRRELMVTVRRDQYRQTEIEKDTRSMEIRLDGMKDLEKTKRAEIKGLSHTEDRPSSRRLKVDAQQVLARVQREIGRVQAEMDNKITTNLKLLEEIAELKLTIQAFSPGFVL